MDGTSLALQGSMSTYLQFQTSNAPLLLADDHNCARLWALLKKRFPRAYAAVLLPEGGHILVPDAHTEVAQFRLQITLRSLFPSVTWRAPLPPLARIGSARTLSTLRHILHKPVNQGLCRTPCHWQWSSSLDMIGAIEGPWMTVTSIEKSLGRPRMKFREQFFNYLAVEDYRDFEPTQSHPHTLKKRRYSAQEILASVALSTRMTPFEVLQKDSEKQALSGILNGTIRGAELHECEELSAAAKYCLFTPEILSLSPIAAAQSALSRDTGKSGRALRSQASTTAGVASSNSGWTMESVA